MAGWWHIPGSGQLSHVLEKEETEAPGLRSPVAGEAEDGLVAP
jgi:hypothetical protein